jgi:hypothetical protein
MKKSQPNHIEVAKAGINRFLDEGFTSWPEDKLRPLFLNRPLEDESIKAILTLWEESGSIRLLRHPDAYIQVLKHIE